MYSCYVLTILILCALLYIYPNIDIMLDGEVVACEERVLYVVPGIEAPLVLLLVY